ncbi:MAG: efflux transporter, family, subunit [Bacteroidetes bacterium]|nr:efflux transporter, family, subunit [Bacteroidota bacterium]
MANESRSSYVKLLIIGIVVLLLLGGGIAAISISKSGKVKNETKNRVSALKEGPVVKTDIAKLSSDAKQIILLGEARPFENATVYSRISGYMDKILVDKGDKVTKDQLIAVIDNPEIGQQYNAALADLENKRKIQSRDSALLIKNYISKEEADLSLTAVRLAEANFRSISEQRGYQQVRAPFTGTVTARFVDPGALIQNANNSQAAQPLITVSQLGKLRIYVYVEQRDAGFLREGYPVVISLTEKPDMQVKATVTRMTGALDVRTRMMTVEIDLDNKDNAIIPGSYVQVRISGPQTKASQIQVPATALVFHKGKALVAVIDKDTILHFKSIKVGENTGDKVTILEGLNEGDRVALQVGESVLDGQKVRLEQ